MLSSNCAADLAPFYLVIDAGLIIIAMLTLLRGALWLLRRVAPWERP